MNEAGISLRHIEVLSLLLELKSLTRAADVLGANQPTVSKILARLRSHFGDALFVRVGLSMHPTPLALEIAKPLQDLLLVSVINAIPNIRVRPLHPKSGRHPGIGEYAPWLVRRRRGSCHSLGQRLRPVLAGVDHPCEQAPGQASDIVQQREHRRHEDQRQRG
jgi:hypothetical protein